MRARLPANLAMLSGAWLVAAPVWMPGYAASTGFAAVHSIVVGVLVLFAGIFGVARAARWGGAALLGFTIWLIAAPLVIGFIRTAPGPAWNQILTGFVLLVATFSFYQSVPPQTPSLTSTGFQ